MIELYELYSEIVLICRLLWNLDMEFRYVFIKCNSVFQNQYNQFKRALKI